MHFQVSGVDSPLWLPPLAAFVISFFTSMGGVSGAFLLLPFQVSFLGYTAPSVSATNQLFNIVAIPGGLYRYWKERRMVWPLAAIVAAGTLPGVFIGALIRIYYLPDSRNFKLFVACILLIIGGRMAYDLVHRWVKGKAAGNDAEDGFHKAVIRSSKENGKVNENRCRFSTSIVKFDARSLVYRFFDKDYVVPVWAVFFLSLVVGVVGGVYGIGGGSIMAPFFVSILGLPVYTVAGAALMGTFVTSVFGVGFYQGISFFIPELAVGPDWLLGMLLGVGGTAGIYCGARFQKYVPADGIKFMLAVIMFFIAIRYVAAFIS